MSDISIMCVTYNRLDFTKRWYNSLLEKTTVPFNLIIVDNASGDGTVDYLKTLKEDKCLEKLVIQYNEKNKGIAIGRNQGLKIADGLNTKWYCTVDNDVEMPHNNWLQECVDILKANPQYGCCGVNFEDNQYPLVTKNGFTFQEKARGNLGTACMVFPKSIHNLIGFFNTEYGLYSVDDSDFGARLNALSIKLAYLKDPGIHFGSGNAEEKNYRKWKDDCHKNTLDQFRRNCAAYYRKEKSVYIPYKDEP
jgi:GT2 family glycosyltransferase